MIYYGNELYHHGILGQKWGIRRFQNRDGSYTEEGKKRRRSDSYSEDYKKYSNLKKKNVKEMSNRELQDFNNRARLEQEYSRLNPSAIQKGMQFAAAASMAALTLTQLYNNYSSLSKIGKKVVKNMAWKNVGK